MSDAPQQPSTQPSPASAPPDDTRPLLEKLVIAVGEVRSAQEEGFKNVRADMSLIASDLTIVKDRVSVVENRTTSLEGRVDSHSMRAKAPSMTDLETQSQLASEIEARKALASEVASVKAKTESIEQKTDAQTVILNRIDTVAKNPIVKAVGLALLMALAQWLGTKGIHVALPQ